MKIEMMEYLANKIIKDGFYEEHCVDRLKKIIIILDTYPSEDRKKIMDILEECDFDSSICDIVINSKKSKTVDETIKLIMSLKDFIDIKKDGIVTNAYVLRKEKSMKTLKDFIDYYDYYIGSIECKTASNSNVLKTKTTDEIIKLMMALKELPELRIPRTYSFPAAGTLNGSATRYLIPALELVRNLDVLKTRTTDEIIKLMIALEEFLYSTDKLQISHMYNPDDYEYLMGKYTNSVCVLITNPDLLLTRTTDEVIKLVMALKELVGINEEEYTEYAVKIATNLNVLKTKTIDEIIKLIVEFKNIPDYDDKILEKAYEIATNLDVLENRTTDEIIKLMTTVENVSNSSIYNPDISYFNVAYEIATNLDILENRTADEQIKLMMEVYKEPHKINGFVYWDMMREEGAKIATDLTILLTMTIDQQIELLKNYYQTQEEKDEPFKVKHDENMSHIRYKSQLKKYLEDLKQEFGENSDIKSYTMTKIQVK